MASSDQTTPAARRLASRYQGRFSGNMPIEILLRETNPFATGTSFDSAITQITVMTDTLRVKVQHLQKDLRAMNRANVKLRRQLRQAKKLNKQLSATLRNAEEMLLRIQMRAVQTSLQER